MEAEPFGPAMPTPVSVQGRLETSWGLTVRDLQRQPARWRGKIKHSAIWIGSICLAVLKRRKNHAGSYRWGCRQSDAAHGLSKPGTILLTRARRVLVSAETDIAAPPDLVYHWVTAPERVAQWVKDLVESRPLSEGVTLEVGARSIEVLKVGSKLLEVRAEVTALVPGRLIENRLETPGGPTTSRVDIDATSTGCTVRQSMDAVIEGMRLIPSSVLTSMLTQRLNGDLRRLKKLAESH